MTQRVLVVGSDGYIGTQLCGRLQRSSAVLGIDTGFYADATLYAPSWDPPPTIRVDVRDVSERELVGVDAVVYLADLTDPLSQAFPRLADAINHLAAVRLASISKLAGVQRFVYSSSASVYGDSGVDIVDEDSPTRPLTPYAAAKLQVERHLGSLHDDSFTVVCLRNATVYGRSPRIRLDLMVNGICASVAATGRVQLTSDGSAWRPFIHIDDLCEAIEWALALQVDTASALVVNVGDGQTGNWRVMDIARLLATMAHAEVVSQGHIVDERSYRLSTSKLNELGFRCTRDLAAEMESLVALFCSTELGPSGMRRFSRTDRILDLISSGRLDGELRWREQ